MAIADRVSDAPGAASFRIEFSVSGLESKTVAFESDQDALTVRVSDVDHDNDLDLVVSAALSHEVVGVWLNDGSGGVQPVGRAPFASEIGPVHSLDAADSSTNASNVGLTPDDGAGLLPGRPLVGGDSAPISSQRSTDASSAPRSSRRRSLPRASLLRLVLS